ncbi:hypothetical protein [Rhodoferax sp.]|uniref:hypothetical protein n=1 Tax=Rhodoferax sp. TaxID=50421 RepID=UPI00374DF0B1
MPASRQDTDTPTRPARVLEQLPTASLLRLDQYLGDLIAPLKTDKKAARLPSGH